MRLLLDTNVFLWANGDPDRLGPQRRVLEDARNDRLVSAVVAWEIVIKHAIGRLDLPEPASRYLPTGMRQLAATPVAIEHAHALGVANLPLFHGDPFDRLLIAQARALDVLIMTADPVFGQYDVDVLLIE